MQILSFEQSLEFDVLILPLFLLCVSREVFLVHKEMLLAPKVYSPFPNSLLHIIDNDTGEELDMVFNKAATLVYQPNKVCRCYQALDFTSDMDIFP